MYVMHYTTGRAGPDLDGPLGQDALACYFQTDPLPRESPRFCQFYQLAL